MYIFFSGAQVGRILGPLFFTELFYSVVANEKNTIKSQINAKRLFMLYFLLACHDFSHNVFSVPDSKSA